MKWLWVNKKNEEFDEKYLCCYNELQFQIENEVNKIDKIQIMFFYCDLNELICRKICKQFELLTTKKNIIILIKKLWSNLFFYKQQTVQFYQKKFKLHNKKNERSVIAYWDLIKIFSESNVNNLSLYCKQNHIIELLNRKTSLFDSIYNLSKKKLTEFWRYLNENFKNKFIKFSQSFIKTLMLFVSK